MTAPGAADREHRPSAAAFLGAVRAELRRAGLSVPDLAQDVGRSAEGVRDGVQRRVREWSFYRRVLNACAADTATVEHLHGLWRSLDTAHRAGTSRPANVVPMSRYAPEARKDEPRAVPVRDDELAAGTPAEFISLLRRIQVRSGLTPAEVAVRGGIPRSTAYRFVNDQKNTSLPTKMEQVRAFAVACGLPEAQVEKVVVVWCELQGAPVAASPPVAPPEPAPHEAAARTHDEADPDEALNIRDVVVPLLTGLARPVLAMASVLVTTGLTASVVVFASGWPAGQQVIVVMLMALLFTMIATAWCLGAGQRVDPERRRRGPSPEGGLVVDDVAGAPAVIGLDDPAGPGHRV
ncbi:helix-turn-helix domain-containing protein [Saccharothrix saharensis]|uniref:helix-turn-helix domain-containing protein n=1 Tax=Saccharothrix saharensis TaxID=571190 RepID=UPI00367DBA98